MASRGTTLLTEIVNAIQARSDAEDFTDFQPTIVKSYGHAYRLEDLTSSPTVYVRLIGKSSAPASRVQYRQEFTIGIEIVASIPTTNETNDDEAVYDIETYCNFVDEIERVMREDCKFLASCTLLGYEADPLYSESTQEDMNMFQSLAVYTYVITENNTL